MLRRLCGSETLRSDHLDLMNDLCVCACIHFVSRLLLVLLLLLLLLLILLLSPKLKEESTLDQARRASSSPSHVYTLLHLLIVNTKMIHA